MNMPHINYPDWQRKEYKPSINPLIWLLIIITVISILIIWMGTARAEDQLKASWYSMESLKQEGTFKYSKGVMANGKLFDDTKLTCACRLYPLGAVLRITNMDNGRMVCVRVTDRIGKRFAQTRIDLSRSAFMAIANLKQGLVSIKVERLK